MEYLLVIDDERCVSDLLQETLAEFGFRVETASGGDEGIRLFNREDFDLVITDMIMPNMDGNGVARHIRSSRKPHTPIIGISGTPWFLEEDQFDCVMPKPFRIQSLVKTIEKLLGCVSMPRKSMPLFGRGPKDTGPTTTSSVRFFPIGHNPAKSNRLTQHAPGGSTQRKTRKQGQGPRSVFQNLRLTLGGPQGP